MNSEQRRQNRETSRRLIQCVKNNHVCENCGGVGHIGSKCVECHWPGSSLLPSETQRRLLGTQFQRLVAFGLARACTARTGSVLKFTLEPSGAYMQTGAEEGRWNQLRLTVVAALLEEGLKLGCGCLPNVAEYLPSG